MCRRPRAERSARSPALTTRRPRQDSSASPARRRRSSDRTASPSTRYARGSSTRSWRTAPRRTSDSTSCGRPFPYNASVDRTRSETSSASSPRMPPAISPARRSTSTAAACSCELELERALLEREQPALAVGATAVSGEAPVGADHAMARDDDGNPVVAVRAAHGSRRTGPADAPSDRVVGRRGAEWNLEERAPHAGLKGCSVEHERDREDLPFAGEIFVELALG